MLRGSATHRRVLKYLALVALVGVAVRYASRGKSPKLDVEDSVSGASQCFLYKLGSPTFYDIAMNVT